MMEQYGTTIWSEQITSKGEDAKPSFIFNKDLNKTIIAVYDGMGGAGSASYNYHGKEHTGAYIAATETKNFFETEIEKFLKGNLTISDILINIEKNLFQHLQFVASEIDKNPSRIKSSLIKRLPTTIAAAICEEDILENQVRITCLWAGDSRCYAFTPEHGLVQLTADDIKGQNDALLNLKNDSPMSNYCNADVPFKINIISGTETKPLIILAATDGCFGYFPTPFHFEYIILQTLLQNDIADLKEWVDLIQIEIKKITGDDFSMSLCSFGFPNIISIQDSFDIRMNIVQNDFINRYVTAEKNEFETKLSYEQAIVDKENLLKELWNSYKLNYQHEYEKR